MERHSTWSYSTFQTSQSGWFSHTWTKKRTIFMIIIQGQVTNIFSYQRQAWSTGSSGPCAASSQKTHLCFNKSLEQEFRLVRTHSMSIFNLNFLQLVVIYKTRSMSPCWFVSCPQLPYAWVWSKPSSITMERRAILTWTGSKSVLGSSIFLVCHTWTLVQPA